MADPLITKKITDVQMFTNNAGTILQIQSNQLGQTPIDTMKDEIKTDVVAELLSEGGVSLGIVNIKGVVPTIADLDLITDAEINDAYQVEADGLVYVWLGDSWSDGLNVLTEPTGVVEEGNTQAVSGGEVFEKVINKSDIKYNSINIFSVENVVYNKYINGSGVVTDMQGTSYGVISLLNNTSNRVTVYNPSDFGDSRRSIFRNAEGELIGSVINTGAGNTTYRYTIPVNAVELLFTIETVASTVIVDVNLIRANYGTEIVDGSHVLKIKDKPIFADINNTQENKDFIKENDTLNKVEIQPYNLINPIGNKLDKQFDGVNYVDSTLYNATDFIEITPNTEYYLNASNGVSPVFRSYRVLNASKTQIQTVTVSGSVFNTSNSNARYVVFNFFNTIPIEGVSLSLTNEGFKPYKEGGVSYELPSQIKGGDNSIVTNKILDEVISALEIDNKVNITLSNSDKILFTGSSSIESLYCSDYKYWGNRLQDHLDIQLVPYGWSGLNGNAIADKLNNDTATNVGAGVKPSEINPTYVFIGPTLNAADLLDDEFDTSFVESCEKLLKSAVTITGAKPIVGTMYRTEFRPWIENSLKNIANKWGADFIPIGTYNRSMIRTNKYNGFYGDGHPGNRTNEAYTLPLLNYFNQLPRPKQGILIFEARNQNSDILELIYKDNYNRAEKFRSIQVGERALSVANQEMYDRINESVTFKTNTSQYMQLMRGNPITLSDKVLIEIISPNVRFEKATVNLSSVNISELYIFNNLTNNWELTTSLEVTQRKYVEFDKIKLLLVGTNIVINSISVDIEGGVEKPSQTYDRIDAIKSGKVIVESEGFTDVSVVNWDIGTNTRYNITTKYSDSRFNDMPLYLGESKDLITLTDILKRDINLNDIQTFGYRKIRVWTCSRINPKIFNPTEFENWTGVNNPYTNVSWSEKNKYDYDDLAVILRYKGVSYENECKSINIQKVGLFWNLNYIDIDIPVARNGNYELQFFRSTNNNYYDMEICDVSVEVLY